jgi:hypothetical protein
MEKFVTQFTMSGIKTDATVYVREENQFGFVTHLSDAFEGGELTPEENEEDGIIRRDDNGRWQILGESKIHLTEDDVQSLGSAIEQDYIK